MKRILLAGASGAVGRQLLGLLRADGHFVRTLSRHPGRAGGLAAGGRIGDPHARRCVELAFAAVGRRPHVPRMPWGLFATIAFFLRPLQPRLADLLAFRAALGRGDALAPAVGSLRLADYHAEVVRR